MTDAPTDSGANSPLPETVAEAHAPGRLRLVEGFINTLHMDLGTSSDIFRTPGDLHEWLVAAGLIEPNDRLAEADLARAVALREALRELAFANNGEDPPEPDALEVIDRESARVAMRVSVDGEGARLEPAGQGLDRAFAHIFMAIQEATLQGTWERLKACRSGECRWAFYDSTRNRAGRWCGATCSNRSKVRAFRQRQRQEK